MKRQANVIRVATILALVTYLAMATPMELRPLLYLVALGVGLFTERAPQA